MMAAEDAASKSVNSKKRTRDADDDAEDASKRSREVVVGGNGDATKKGPKEGDVTINDDEAALYDRQIRLWGLDGQQRWA